nr:Bacterial alpha-L-rhamnosidase [Bacillota bacterium]
SQLEKPGWNTPGYADSDWSKAQIVEPPDGELTSQLIPAIKVVKTIKPVRILNPEENVYVYDFGQHFSGWTRLRVSGSKNTKVTLRYAGRVYDDYKLDRRNNQSAEQTDTYILKGEGTEIWEPRFTLHGFRYVEVTGLPGRPRLESLEGCFVRSVVETSGSFTCSNPLLNQIHHNICWTFMSSFQSIPQDAAERDERVGWLGDPGFVAEDYIYNFDTASFWAKWLNDIKDSQKPDGNVPFVSPLHWRDASSVYSDMPAWKSSYPLFVWYVYQYYQDKRILRQHYDGLKKLVDFLSAKADNCIVSCGLGDHMEPQNSFSNFTPKHTPVPLTSTAYYYYDAWILSQIAEILGKAEDAKYYSDLAKNIKEAFNREFFDYSTSQYSTGSQTSNALPLYLGMTPEGREKAVAKNLVNDIIMGHNGHLSTGIIGTNALAQVLSKWGWVNIMYQIATQTTFPSWGYEVLRGATTLWEAFEYCPQYLISLNMKMFGSVEKFFYKDLAGISLAEPGYKRITIKPHIVDDLKYVKASIKTVKGKIKSNWVRTSNEFQLDVSIPVNSQAKVSIPKMGLENVAVKESGKIIFGDGSYLGGVAGIIAARESAQYITFNVGCGSYSFKLGGTLKKPLIKYSNLELSGSVKSGEPFEISATIENLSSYNLLPEVKVYYDRTINSKVIPLGDGESRKLAFTIKLDETGDHKVSIGSLSPKNINVREA